MLSHYQQLLQRLSLGEEATDYLWKACETLLVTHSNQVVATINAFTDGQTDLPSACEQMRPLAAALSIPWRTSDFIVVACASHALLNDYLQSDFSETLFWNTMGGDLRCKLKESHAIHGEWGLNYANWYTPFFKKDLFRLGRLEYERCLSPMKEPITVGNHIIRPEDTVYSIHIPSTGEPLDRKSRMESYRLAYDFFAEERRGEPLYACCLSWLLFPANREIFPLHLNTVDFMNDFKIVDSQPNEFRDLWRVFGVPFNGDLSVLPRDNTMRRAFGTWLDQGGIPGYGVGYFVFDGQHILTQ